MVDPKYIKNIQGKDFVLYEGLISQAHKEGLSGIETEIVQFPNKEENGYCCIVKATITIRDGHTYTGYGDAAPYNVGKMIQPHIIRMAETRAKARALRDACDIGMTAFEELGDMSE